MGCTIESTMGVRLEGSRGVRTERLLQSGEQVWLPSLRRPWASRGDWIYSLSCQLRGDN